MYFYCIRLQINKHVCLSVCLSGWNRSVVIWLNAFTGFSDGAVEVHSLDYCTVVFASCDSVRVDVENRVGTPPDTT